MNFYPFHIGDYISHTSHLTDEEDLAYRRMIDLYYQTEKPFTQDPHWIAKRCRTTVEIVHYILSEYFEVDVENSCWRNKRADEEIAKYHAMQEGGRLGAQKRWGNRADKGSDSPPKHPPMQTKNQEPRTINHINTPEGVNESLFKDFLEVRKTKKAKWTETALKGLQREAGKANMTLEQVMQMCCERGWAGFKAEWAKDVAVANQPNNDKSWMFSNEGITAKARELGVNDYGVGTHQQLKDKILLIMAKKAMQ
jgi:uncharacterized protein YdaU (DUF1376 family)